VGLETLKNMVFQAHPGPLEIRIMALPGPLLEPILRPLQALSQGFLEGPFSTSLTALFKTSLGLPNNLKQVHS